MSLKFYAVGLSIALLLMLSSCGENGAEKLNAPTEKEKIEETKIAPIIEKIKPISFKDIRGRWRLKYANNYGYEFRLYKNYRAIVIIFLKENSLVFRGIYTIESDNILRITLSEMKRVSGVRNLNVRSKFVKTKSSYFVFRANLKKEKKKLYIRPKTIYIDGNNSEGYFEPLIKLKKIR